VVQRVELRASRSLIRPTTDACRLLAGLQIMQK
jgi:hypothetical protein